jgi:transposase
MAAVRANGTPRVDARERLDGVAALGVDETAFQAASATRSTSFATGIVDLTRRDRPARLLDVVADRSASALVSWMGQRSSAWRAGIATAALDPYRGYALALRTALPHTVRVLMPSTWCASASPPSTMSAAASSARTPGTADAATTRSTASAGCCAAHEHHSERSWTRLLAGLDAGDTPDEQLARTWVAAQDLRLIFACPDRERAQQNLFGGWPTAPTPTSPNCPGWPAPSTPGVQSCWPTSTPAACPTAPPKRSTY